MNTKMKIKVLGCISLLNLTCLANAHEVAPASRADSHAPISVMGDHMHKQGEWMVSYRYMSMAMSGNLLGDKGISDSEIATTQANPYAGMPMMPPTLRVVPQEMTTAMHMVGVMYAPSDDITLMAMFNYIDKIMQLKTYQGMMGATELGYFDSASSGMGDTKLGVLYRLFDNSTHHLHANLSVSLPTGAIDKSGEVLTPMNMRMQARLPYAMQLGSGTVDWLPGITYTGKAGDTTWGAQYVITLRNSENDEGYQLGNEQALNAWGQYSISPSVSVGVGGEYLSSDAISGMDDEIMLPVQTANPANYGRDVVNAKASLNWVGQQGALRDHRFALEYSVPIKQEVNGLQMEMDSMFTFGYQKAF